MRNIATVQRECNRSVVIGVDDEVGGNLLHVSSLCFAHRCARFRVQLSDFCLQGFYLCIVQFQSCLDLVPMFLGKLVKIVGKHLFHRLAEHTSRQSLNLQQEAFLQTSSSYTGWVEGL